VGRNQFPCWMFASLVPTALLQASVVLVRCLNYHFRVRFHKLLAKERASKLFEMYMTSVGATRQDSIISGNESVDVASDTLSLSKASSSYESSTGSASSKSLKWASYYASSRFGWHILAFLLLLLVIKLVSVFSLTFGCTGCKPILTDLYQIVIAGFLICVPNYVLLWIHRKEPDPLNILSEIGLNMIIPTALFFGWIVLFIVDPGNIHADGKWSWHYLTVFMSFSFFMLTIPLQIYYSYKMDECKDRDEAFTKILESERGKELFKAHLAEEVSIENYLFYEKARKWKSSFRAGKQKTVRDFKFLYDTFIKDGSFLQINISERTKQILDGIQRNPTNQLSEGVFDECIFEVFHMMLDSYPRFLRSEHYEKYQAHMTDSGILGNSL